MATTSLNTSSLECVRLQLNENLEQIIKSIANRDGLSRQVAELKKRQGLPIHHPHREAEVLKLAEQLADQYGAYPDLVKEVVSLLIVHSKEVQCEALNRDTFFDLTRPCDQTLRDNLIRLTRVTAREYESRFCEPSSLRVARAIERSQLQKTINSIDRRGLALDLGCAKGKATEVLAAYFQSVRSIDISEFMISAAQERIKWPANVAFEIGDVFDGVPADSGTASLIVADFGAASEVCRSIFNEVSRLLHPGGKALLSFYNREAIDTKSYYPSTATLRSHVNIFNDTVEVWYDGNTYVLHAEAVTRGDIHRRATAAGLTVDLVGSFPTVLSILSSYQCDRKHRVDLADEASRIDERLMYDIPMRGHYLMAVLRK